MFYPAEGDISSGDLTERIEEMLGSAQQFRAVILDKTHSSTAATTTGFFLKFNVKKPCDIEEAFNWDELSRLLREIKELDELSQEHKTEKVQHLNQMVEIYEVLKGAKKPKLADVITEMQKEIRLLNPDLVSVPKAA